MSGIRDRDCLCNHPAGVTFFEILGQRVGISGAQELFRRWLQAGREPAGLSPAEVLAGVRERNYVSALAERAYVEAVRSAYACWSARAGQAVQRTSHAQG